MQMAQTNDAGVLGTTALAGVVRAQLDHKLWTVLSSDLTDPGNGRVTIDGGNGRLLLMPVMGTVLKSDGQPLEGSYSAEILALVHSEVHTEWLEPADDGGVLLRRVYKERGSKRDNPKRNELIGTFGPGGGLQQVVVTVDMGTRVAAVVRVREVALDIHLDGDGMLVSEALMVGARVGPMRLSLSRQLQVVSSEPCSVGAG